jgi:hypothetical protein
MGETDLIQAAGGIMREFARDTGLTSDAPPRRYLWTDAFAVCNCLGLYEATGDGTWRELAVAVIDQVHRVLGRHRPDDPRTGWISGLSEKEGARRPTAGGLRIGKPLAERGPDERWDPGAEWDRDGQYFHYLTKWMHALARAWSVTGESRFHEQALDLALAAHRGFVRDPGAGSVASPLPPMSWKMSVDLSRPLVSSMGHHDPLDGHITLRILRATSPDGARTGSDPLDAAITDFRDLCDGMHWATDDSLGIGGLLTDAWRLGWLAARESTADQDLARAVVRDAAVSLSDLERTGGIGGPAAARLPFRELGLAIGLAAPPRLARAVAARGAAAARDADLETLLAHAPLGDRIRAFWLHPGHREASTWTEHLDINRVMLATSLAPDGFLQIAPA